MWKLLFNFRKKIKIKNFSKSATLEEPEPSVSSEQAVSAEQEEDMYWTWKMANYVRHSESISVIPRQFLWKSYIWMLSK